MEAIAFIPTWLDQSIRNCNLHSNNSMQNKHASYQYLGETFAGEAVYLKKPNIDCGSYDVELLLRCNLILSICIYKRKCFYSYCQRLQCFYK